MVTGQKMLEGMVKGGRGQGWGGGGEGVFSVLQPLR